MKPISILLVLFWSSCYSQMTLTFPFNSDTTNEWIYISTDNNLHSEKFTTRFGKDTLMPNNKTYTPYWGFFFRQDSSKVYDFEPDDSSEYVRYDFSKSVGDTVGLYKQAKTLYPIIVIDDHPLSVFGKTRRVISFTNHQGTVADEVADSIGIIAFGQGLEAHAQLLGAIISGQVYGDITSVKQHGDFVPSVPNLVQNFPNPFNPVTTIQYDLPKSMYVKIVITNAIGEQVVSLVNSYQREGSYRINWDASNYSSQTYFCTLTSANFVKTIKLILLK
jgi:Secretion system C-terminal sorting domain